MSDKAFESFFNQMYDQYHKAVYAYILGRISSKDSAKELLQETFLRIWNHIHVGYDMGLDKSRFWLFKITKNIITDYYRRRASRLKAEEQFKANPLLPVMSVYSPEDAYQRKNDMRLMEAAINNLPEQLRIVLVMQVIGHMNSTEIGEMIEIPPGTVRYRISLARKRLINEMNIMNSVGEETYQ